MSIWINWPGKLTSFSFSPDGGTKVGEKQV
jgi:hypothetical protein